MTIGIDVSAKTRVNVDLAFEQLIRLVVKMNLRFHSPKTRKKLEKSIVQSIVITLVREKQKKIEERALAFEKVIPKPIPMHPIPSVSPSIYTSDIKYSFLFKGSFFFSETTYSKRRNGVM